MADREAKISPAPADGAITDSVKKETNYKMGKIDGTGKTKQPEKNRSKSPITKIDETRKSKSAKKMVKKESKEQNEKKSGKKKRSKSGGGNLTAGSKCRSAPKRIETKQSLRDKNRQKSNEKVDREEAIGGEIETNKCIEKNNNNKIEENLPLMKGKMMKMKSCEAVNLDDNRISKMKIVSCEQRTAKSSGKIAAMNQNGSESHRKELNQTRGVEKENKPPIGKVLSQFANTIVEQVKGFMKEQQQQQQQQRNESSESKRPRRRSSATNANKSNNLISGGSSAQLISRVENKKSLPISASSTDITGKVGGSKKSPNDNLAKNSLHKSDNDNDDDEISKKMKKKRSKSGSEQSVARKKTNRKSSLTEAIQNLRGVASVDDVAVKVERSDQNRSKKRGKNRRSKRKSAGFNPNAHYDYDPIELEVVEMKTMLKAGGGKLIHRVYARSLSRLSPTGDFAKNNNNNNSNSVSRKKKGSVKSSGSKKRKKKKKKSKKKKRGKTNRKSCRKSGPGAPQKSSSISGRVAARNKQSKTAVVAVVEKQDRKIAGKKSPTFGGDDRTNLVMKQNDASGQNGGGGKRSK